MKLFIVMVFFTADTLGKKQFLIACSMCEYRSSSLKFIEITHKTNCKIWLGLTK